MRAHQVVSMAAALVVAMALALPVPAQETAEELYQAALYQEEVQGDLERAIGLFERILAEFPSDRPVAANALMRIGLCHEKLGSREARRAYQRLLRDYADQVTVADRARARLESLQGLAGAEPPPTPAPGPGIVVRHLRGGDVGVELDATGPPSPDGRYLAGVVWGETASNVVVLDLVTGESRQLTDHPDYERGMALSAGFAPDGNTIDYWWFNADESAEVRLAFRDGSPPRTLSAEPGFMYWAGPWRADATQLLVSRKGPGGRVETGWVSVEDGHFQAFGAIPEPRPRPRRVSLSADERYLAFDFAVAEDSDRLDISMIPVDGGPAVSIVRHPANDRVVGWVPGTDEFLFVSDRGGKSDLYAIKVAAGAAPGSPRIVRRDVGLMGPNGFTRDGDLFYWIYTLRMFISVAPFDPETGAVDAEAARPLLGPKANPIWSPDGRYLAYWHKKDRPTGASDWDQILGITDLATGEEWELSEHLEVSDPRWSRDGRFILAKAVERDRGRDQAPALYRIDPRTGETMDPIRLSPKPDPEWYWSIGVAEAPNGRDIVYVRDGRLVLHQVATGEETEVYRHPGLVSGLLDPAPDGRSLLFAVQDSTRSGLSLGTVARLEDGWGRLMVARLPEGDTRELLAVDLAHGTQIRNAEWGPRGRYVYFTETARDEGTVLKRVPVHGGEPEVAFASRERLGEFAISPAGDRIAFTIGENKGDQYVMENLRAALEEMREGR